MVADVIIAAFVGGFAGSTIQAIVSRKNTEKRIQAQHDRRIGEFFLDEKVRALTEYHVELERFIEEIRVLKNRAYFSDERDEDVTEVRSDVVEVYNDYHRSLTRASIFLTEEQHEVLNETLMPFREASKHVEDSVSEDLLTLMADDEWNYEEVIESFNDAREVVKREIQQGLNRLESSE